MTRFSCQRRRDVGSDECECCGCGAAQDAVDAAAAEKAAGGSPVASVCAEETDDDETGNDEESDDTEHVVEETRTLELESKFIISIFKNWSLNSFLKNRNFYF